MDKRTKIFIGSGAFIAAIIIAVYLLYYKPKKLKELRKDREIEDLKNTIKENEAISQQEREGLNELVSHFAEIDEDIAEQITEAVNFLGMKKPEEAIRKLGVLAENLMENLYAKNEEYSKWKKAKGKPHNFGNMLLYCKDEDKLIVNSEYGALFFLKEMRNEESHKINVQFDQYIQKSGLIVAIGTIKKLAIIGYPKE